jgi:phage terminase large subunit GpA-like protein
LINSRKSLTPPPALSLSEWADTYAYLSPESSAQPGKWKNIPYQIGMLDAVTDPDVEKISIMKSARVGYSKMLNHVIGFHVHQDPCPLMLVQPTIDDAQGYSKDEIGPMIRDTPVLQGLITDSGRRNSENTILKKGFPGGQLLLIGANSARGFRRVSVRKVLFDEVDGYPPTAGQEGDQIKLGTKRTDFFFNRQVILGSTPTIKGASRIEDSFEQSDKRFYFVPCPFCGGKQPIEWKNIDFSDRGTVDDPVLICTHCNEAIDYSYHRYMIERGEWKATAPEVKGHAGFHIWAAYSYSPNATWAKIVREFLESKDDPEKLKTFVNTVLGETWEEIGVTQNSGALYESREEIPVDPVPWEVGFITAAVDTQDNRLEMLVKGWGKYEESYDLEFHVVHGSPAHAETWEKLDVYLQRNYTHESGAILRISCVTIDSGGHFTDYVHSFCKNKAARGVYSIKGASQQGKPIVSRGSKNNKGKVDQFNVGTHAAKDLIFSRYAIVEAGEYGPGFIHFNDFDFEYFEQLTAEKVITKYKKGFPYREYVKTRPRNEALDLQVYNLAALRIACPDVEILNKYVDYVQARKEKTERNVETPEYKEVQKRRPRGRRQLSKGIE